jgi:molecular chaperone HscB
MTTAALHDETLCWRCGARRASAVTCAACEAPQALAPDADLFAVLGLPRRLVIDRDDLEQRYLAASRAVHPDRHQTGDERTRQLSLVASAAVNRAYRTLRDPIARGRYWLELHGESLGRDNNRVPPELAELVFETQEALESFRQSGTDRAAIERTHAELDARVRDLVGELGERYAAWDAGDPAAAPALAELKRRLSDVAYLETLVEDLDEAVGG